MSVFLLEWRLVGGDGGDSGWQVECVCQGELLAFEHANAGLENGSPLFEFKATSDFCGDKRYISNQIDGERWRVREFKVQIE